jgi:ribosomal protein L23
LVKNVYVFEIMKDATKIDVKKAIKEIYWVEVLDVNVLYEREKFKHWKKRWWIVLRKRVSKKAYVTLKDSKAKIDFTIVTK